MLGFVQRHPAFRNAGCRPKTVYHEAKKRCVFNPRLPAEIGRARSSRNSISGAGFTFSPAYLPLVYRPVCGLSRRQPFRELGEYGLIGLPLIGNREGTIGKSVNPPRGPPPRLRIPGLSHLWTPGRESRIIADTRFAPRRGATRTGICSRET